MNIIVLLRKQRERERRETSFDDIPVMFTSANFIRPQIFYFFQQIVLQFFCDIHIFPREIGHIVQVGTALCVFFSSLVVFFFFGQPSQVLYFIFILAFGIQKYLPQVGGFYRDTHSGWTPYHLKLINVPKRVQIVGNLLYYVDLSNKSLS